MQQSVFLLLVLITAYSGFRSAFNALPNRVEISGNKYAIMPQDMSPKTRLLLGLKINLNQMTYETWLLLPGIGPKTAAAIMAYKESKGRFNAVSDLLDVKGIGPKILERLDPYLTME